jgi:hypothetical protein
MPSAAAVGPVRAPGIWRARWRAGHPSERSAASWREPGDVRIEERRPWQRRRCSDWAVGSGGHPSAQRELGKAAPAREIVQSATSAASAQLEARGDCRRLGWIAPRIRASNRGQVPTSSPANGASNADRWWGGESVLLGKREPQSSCRPRQRKPFPYPAATMWLGPLHWFRSTSSVTRTSQGHPGRMSRCHRCSSGAVDSSRLQPAL